MLETSPWKNWIRSTITLPSIEIIYWKLADMPLGDVPCRLVLTESTLSCHPFSKAKIIWVGNILERITPNRFQRLIFKKTTNNMKRKMINNKHKCSNNNKTKCKSNSRCRWWTIRMITMKPLMMRSQSSSRLPSRTIHFQPRRLLITWVNKIMLKEVKCRPVISSKKIM